MDTESDNLVTPKQTKRLGLRRSSSMLKRSGNDVTRSNAKCRILDVEPPTSTPKSRFPQSDMKINYKGLEQYPYSKNAGDGESTPATPENEISAHLQRPAVSTNCRPFRLALSKRVREKMTKKRLEFYLANEIEKQESQDEQNKSEQQDCKTETSFSSKEELLDKTDCVKKELTARQHHLEKVEELKQAIHIWKTGFSSALHDLQTKIEPRLEISALLERLHIPHEMMKYIDE